MGKEQVQCCGNCIHYQDITVNMGVCLIRPIVLKNLSVDKDKISTMATILRKVNWCNQWGSNNE